MKRFSTKIIFWIGVIVVILLGLSGCAGKTTPPGASMIYGNFIVPEGFGGTFTVLQWQEGLSLTLVDDVDGDHESGGSGTTEDPVWRGHGLARAADGREVSWRVETTDGKTATFFIDEQEYDLEQGTLFLMRTTGGQTQVIQHKQAPAGRCFDYDSCHQALKNDPWIMQFIQETLNQKQKSSAAGTLDTPTPASVQPREWQTYRADSGYEISYPLEVYSGRRDLRVSMRTAEMVYPGTLALEPNDRFFYNNLGVMTYIDYYGPTAYLFTYIGMIVGHCLYSPSSAASRFPQ